MLQNSIFDLKIMKLFLLNSMKNKEPRKIGLTFLPFFYNCFSSSRKRKRKAMSSTGPKVAQAAQTQVESACARPRAGNFAKKPSAFRITQSGCLDCFRESLTSFRNPPVLLILYRPKPTTLHSGGLHAGEARLAGRSKD